MADDIDKAIEEINQILMKKKGQEFLDFIDSTKTKKKLEPVNNDEEESREESSILIKTNTVIDEIIGGGIPEGKSALLYGEFGSGKTQTAFTATALCKGLVIYIDPEDSFSFKRLKEICSERKIDYQEVKKRIILFKPMDWVQQMVILNSIGSPADYDRLYGMKVDLIICDSLSNFFRGVEFQGRNTLPLKTGFLREYLVDLKKIAKQHRAALIVTSQVSEEPVAGAYISKADTQHPIGGHSIEHQPDFVLFFRKGSGNVRVVRMIDSSHKPLAERAFVINSKGIDDLPPESKAGKLYEKGEEKFELKQQQETIMPKAKGEKEEAEESEESV
jgi:RecA/RadA recombinase